MDPVLPVSKSKAARRTARQSVPSVIEASATQPMPVVESAPEPITEPASALAVTTEPAPVSVEPAPSASLVAAAPVPVAPPAAVPAEPVNEDTVMDTVENTTETAANKAQALFADLNDRTKGAVERGAKLVEDVTAFNKGNLEAFVESSRIAARGFESLGQDAAAFAKQSFEQSAAAMRQLATVKSPTEFLKLHGDLVRQSFDQAVAQGSRQTETVLKLAGEVAQPISNRFAVAMEKAKVAA